jgi:hypothetical protein
MNKMKQAMRNSRGDIGRQRGEAGRVIPRQDPQVNACLWEK